MSMMTPHPEIYKQVSLLQLQLQRQDLKCAHGDPARQTFVLVVLDNIAIFFQNVASMDALNVQRTIETIITVSCMNKRTLPP